MDNTFIARYLAWDNRAPNPRYRPLNTLLAKLGLRARLQPAPYRWGMANVEARMNVFHLVSQTCAYEVPGDLVEIGCNAGESSVVIQKVLCDLGVDDKMLNVYDSFAGTPAPEGSDADDAIYRQGAMATTLEKFNDNFRQAGVMPLPRVHVGWFEDTIPALLPARISFAMIDADLYASTRHVLPHVYARMSPGAIGMFGVYYDPGVYARADVPGSYTSPGVKRATDEFFADKPEKVSVLYANEYSNGYFRKQ